MTYTGKLTLLNSVIQSLPMHAMCTFKVPITIYIHFEKSGRQFLWADRDNKIQGKCLASWDMICRPKDQGGLSILNLRLQNKALLMKNLLKFHNHYDIPWVYLIWKAYYNDGSLPHSNNNSRGSFWWKDCISLFENYCELTRINIGNGKLAMLWKDNWDNGLTEEEYDHLHSFAKNKDISVHQARAYFPDDMYEFFHLPMSSIDHEELIELKDDITYMEASINHDV